MKRRLTNAKQCRDSFQQPYFCDPSPVICSVAFWSRFVHSLLLDLDSYDGNNPDGMLILFYKQVARELAKSIREVYLFFLVLE